MNYSESLRSKRDVIKPKHLLKSCQKFADFLAGGEWFSVESSEVEIGRSYTETYGRTLAPVDGTKADAFRLTTEVSFVGSKEINDYDALSRPLVEETYSLVATIRESIHHADIPNFVVEQISEGLMDDEADGSVEIISTIEPSQDFLAKYDFEREHEIGYLIDEEGDVTDYSIVIRYFVDGTEIDEIEYSWQGVADESTMIATSNDDEAVLEWVSEKNPKLTEADLAILSSSFESIIEKITAQVQFDRAVEDAYPEDDEHYRRALGILAMTAAGFKGIKVL